MKEILDRLDQIEANLREPPKAYLNTKEAAKFIGMSKQQLELWRIQCGGPSFHRVGRVIRYHIPDLREFMESHKHNPPQ